MLDCAGAVRQLNGLSLESAQNGNSSSAEYEAAADALLKVGCSSPELLLGNIVT